MEIKDVQANQGNIDIVATVTSKDEPRTFDKFGKQGRVCNAKIKDETGEITLTLWNDDIDSVNVGDKVHIQNGWCSEYRDQKQLSSGKFGKIEVVEASSQEVFTNNAEMLAPQGEVAPEAAGQEVQAEPELSEESEEDIGVEEYVQ